MHNVLGGKKNWMKTRRRWTSLSIKNPKSMKKCSSSNTWLEPCYKLVFLPQIYDFRAEGRVLERKDDFRNSEEFPIKKKKSDDPDKQIFYWVETKVHKIPVKTSGAFSPRHWSHFNMTYYFVGDHNQFICQAPKWFWKSLFNHCFTQCIHYTFICIFYIIYYT